MIDIQQDEFGEIHDIVVDGEKLHSDDGEIWHLPKSLAATLKVADLPANAAFDLCQRAEDGIVILDTVPMRVTKLEDNQVRVDFDETGTRKYWNGFIGFKPYMEARRDVVTERASQVKDITFGHYEDEGNWISLTYSSLFQCDSCETLITLAEELATEIDGAAELRIGSDIWPAQEVDNEKEFTLRTVLPLLRKLGFQSVRYNHGKREFGRDVLFARFTEFGELEHWGAQVKHGDVSGGANSLIDSILGQINDAFKMPFYDIYTRQQQRISRLAIIVSGKFTDNAIEKICESIEIHAIRNNTIFIDCEKIDTLAERFRAV